MNRRHLRSIVSGLALAAGLLAAPASSEAQSLDLQSVLGALSGQGGMPSMPMMPMMPNQMGSGGNGNSQALIGAAIQILPKIIGNGTNGGNGMGMNGSAPFLGPQGGGLQNNGSLPFLGPAGSNPSLSGTGLNGGMNGTVGGMPSIVSLGGGSWAVNEAGTGRRLGVLNLPVGSAAPRLVPAGGRSWSVVDSSTGNQLGVLTLN
ncbi:protein of unknown function (plasmid) [Magnetospirillum sp. XM-1]|uniref:hypothetical protein n=1 Tax=Magnetospirillum sp. XM-1 TaxID=1663591 RepID=UPI00073E011F|nr:hypothetical protein [Magnetospirillum sp. XM-1]CUW41975.1 protein of unknown function [Magnetospirillum sp. XM-1]